MNIESQNGSRVQLQSLSPPRRRSTDRTSAANEVSLAKMPARILLAIADDRIRNDVRALFAPRWNVDYVDNGAKALAAIRAQPPDLIVAGAAMSGLSGIDLLRELRADSRLAAIPVILLSDPTDPMAREQAASVGANDYIVNPFAARELIARAATCLEIARVRRESDRRVTEILESISDSVQVIDVAGCYRYFNACAKKMFAEHGIDADTLIGRRVFDQPFLGTGDASPIAQAISRVMSERVPLTVKDYYEPWKRWYSVRVYPTSAGGVALFAQDITDREYNEQALRDSEERMRLATEAAQVFAWDVDLTTEAVTYSDNVAPVFGYDKLPDVFFNWRSAQSAIHDDDRERMQQATERAIRETGSMAVEYQVQGADGVFLWMASHGTVIRNATGIPTRLLGVGQNISQRKRAEMAWQAYAAEFRAFFELAAVGASQADATTKKFIRVNRKLTEMLGYTADELCGMTFAEVTHPDERNANLELYERAARGELDEFTVEKRLLRKDGTIVWAQVTASVIHDARGRPFRTVAVVEDITERKQANEALKQSEARLAAELQAMSRLHELSTRLLLTTDLPSALNEVLDAAIAMLGAAMGNIQLYNPQTNALEIAVQRGFQREFLDHFRVIKIDNSTSCARALQLGQRVIVEDVQLDPEFIVHRQVAVNAGYRAVQSTPLLSRDGQLLGILSTHFCQCHRPSERELRMLDLYAHQAIAIIERIRVEQALRESEERFRTTADSSPMLIWVIDAAGRIEFLNQTYLEFFGITREQAVEFDWAAIVHPDDREAYVGEFTRAIEQRTALQVRGRVRRSDGQWRWIESRGKPRLDAAGRSTGYVGSSADINDILASQQALTDADRRKDEFLATLSHELRNPLVPIRNSLNILRIAGDMSPMAERVHQMMDRQVAHMVRLVDDLLEVSRITRGQIELRIDPVDLATVISGAIETSKPLIDAADHQLHVELPKEALVLEADAVRLTQVFANLLNNAAKYTETAGQIWLTMRREGNDVVVSVRDTGIGIPADVLPHVFDLFTQADHSRRRAQGGLGIGLTLVRDLVQLHGGNVEARSAGPGEGTEIVVRLPLPAEGRVCVTAKPAPIQAMPSAVRRLRVLVVDDNRDVANSMSTLLQLLGSEVHTVYDGASALEAIAHYKPTMALLDIGMPGLDGYEVARRVRQHYGVNDLRLVALSGWGQQEDRRRSHEAGFDMHLVKPLDLDALEVLLNSFP
ncbi:MAG: PAS domain S-box protein [Gammaproteobacteria bacterium]|nr:PAS domain S-box protein [Gammaproteobacteria bacterium]